MAARKVSRPAYVTAAEWAKADTRRKRLALQRKSQERYRARHRLAPNWQRLADNMIANEVPEKVARRKVREMIQIQKAYVKKYSYTHTGEYHDDEYDDFQHAYDEWFKDLVKNYEYDINEAYPREE